MAIGNSNAKPNKLDYRQKPALMKNILKNPHFTYLNHSKIQKGAKRTNN